MKKIALLVLFLGVMHSCAPDADLFEKLINPDAATLLFPEENSECTTGVEVSESQSEVTFKWSSASSNESYSIHLTDLAENTSQVLETETNELVITINKSKAYSWSVTTINTTTQKETESEIWFFYNSGPSIINHIPFPAVAISPLTGTILSTSSVTLDWEASDIDNDALSFTLNFGTNATPSLFADVLEESIMPNISVSAGTTYYWQIITKDSAGNESFSDIFNFQME